MSNWLGNVSDSEGESTDVESNSDTRTESSEENEGFLRWMKPDDETGGVADENEGKRIMSNYEKAVNVVDDLCTTIRFVDWEDARSLQEAIEKFAEAAQATDNVLKKYGKFPYAFAELLTELGEEIERQKEDAEAGSDDEEEGEENKASKSARKFADLFAKRVEEKRAQYKDHIERVLAGEEDDEEGEESDADADEDGAKLTPEAIEAFLIAGTTSKADIKTCRRVISTSRQGGMKNYEISATAHLCACLLENAPSTGPSSAQWRHAHRALNHSLALAEEHKTSISEATSGKFTPSLAIVKNGWASHAVSLWAAQVKAAQNSEYVPTALRVKDEALCASILDRCLNYYTQIGQKRGLGRCAAALLEILYVRTQEAHEVLNTQAPTFYMLKEKVSVAVAKLARIVEECNPDTDARLMAKMALIFSVALHDRFHEARDLFLNANIALDPIEADDTLLVRYNRVVAQIGLCAFRTGLFNEAHTILGDLCAKNQRDLRELLGQVDLLRAQRHYHDEDVEKTARDRYRFVPPHHALPVNVIEHGHLVLAMANDVIVEAKNPDERPQRSKQFFSLCKRHQSALFRGEPKEDAEFIYAAYEALLEGAMHRAIDYVKRISSWDFLPKGSRAIELLEQKLRQDGLKVFLISRGQHYASLTVDELVARFGLSAEEVKAIVSRLLLDHTLIGHWDHNDTHVVIERGPQSRLHLLSRDCADRIAHFASFNENPAAGPSGRDGRGGRGGFAGGRGRGRGRGSH